MFAGTGGLPDYSLPEDASYPGAQLLATPSPTRGVNWSPPTTAAARQHDRAWEVDPPSAKRQKVAEAGLGAETAATTTGGPGGPVVLPAALPPDSATRSPAAGAEAREAAEPPTTKMSTPDPDETTTPPAEATTTPPPAEKKTFASRYCPKTEAGAETWCSRRDNFAKLVPEESQSAKLQLLFWKFCHELVVKEGGWSEEEAAKEFVKRELAG